MSPLKSTVEGCRRVPGYFEDGLERHVFTTKSGEGLLHDHSRGCMTQGEAEAVAAQMHTTGHTCESCGHAFGKLS